MARTSLLDRRAEEGAASLTGERRILPGDRVHDEAPGGRIPHVLDERPLAHVAGHVVAAKGRTSAPTQNLHLMAVSKPKR